MVRPDRFELPTYWFVASCSIQLSYGRTRWSRLQYNKSVRERPGNGRRGYGGARTLQPLPLRTGRHSAGR